MMEEKKNFINDNLKSKNYFNNYSNKENFSLGFQKEVFIKREIPGNNIRYTNNNSNSNSNSIFNIRNNYSLDILNKKRKNHLKIENKKKNINVFNINKIDSNISKHNKILEKLNIYFGQESKPFIVKSSSKTCKNSNKKRVKALSFDFGNEFNFTKKKNEIDVTRKISNILYNYIINDKSKEFEFRLNKFIHNKDSNHFDNIKQENIGNLQTNIIGPIPNFKNIKKKFAFNKSFDSFDVQSEFFISYLRDEELGSEISVVINNMDNNKNFRNTNINSVLENKENNCYGRKNKMKVKIFQEKIYLNINKLNPLKYNEIDFL